MSRSIHYPDDQPVFIWAASPRSGSTLLQRLVTSSNEILVFGEDFPTFTHLADFLGAAITSEGDPPDFRTLDVAREFQFLDSLTEGRLPDEAGDAFRRKLTDHCVELFDDLVNTYRRKSADHGYERWGGKPMVPRANSIEALDAIFPRGRHLCIYRNIFDVLRSMKPHKMGLFSVDAHWAMHKAFRWRKTMEYIHSVMAETSPAVVVRFEDLVEQRTSLLEEICDHLGIGQMDRDVFDAKVNVRDSQSSDEDQYTDPKELTPEEIDAVREVVPETFLERFGYAFPD